MIILTAIFATIGYLVEQNSYESYEDSYSEEMESYESSCEPGFSVTEQGTTQTLCVFDRAGSIRLDSIERTADATTLNLTHIADGSGYCIWDMSDDRSFKLKDLNTGKAYPLVMQETDIAACEEFTYGYYGEEYPVKMVYEALPSTSNSIEIYENLDADEQFSPTRFDPISLQLSE